MYLHHPDVSELDLATVLHAFSDGQRLRIVRRLADEGELALACGSFGLDVTKSTLTHHFRVLREAGVISQQLVGTAKLNTLRRDDLDARFPGLLDAVLAAEQAAPLPAQPTVKKASLLAGATPAGKATLVPAQPAPQKASLLADATPPEKATLS